MGKGKKRRVRRRLAPYVNEEIRILARVGKLGRDKGKNGEGNLNLLLEEIYHSETQDFLCSHSWIPCNRKIEKANLKEGDIVGIRAEVRSYTVRVWNNKKKLWMWDTDYGFDYPREVVLLERNSSFDEWLAS